MARVGMRMRAVVAVVAVGLLGSAGVATGAVGPPTSAPGVHRISGVDRYEASARISASTFGTGVPVAYVATGEKFPDALSGGPVGGYNGGPVLLVRPRSVPSSVAAELTRLSPGRIVVLGGSASVSAEVQQALGSYTTGTVERISGADRYEASARISASTFGPGVPVAYVATGEKFPDALSGGPVAALEGGPVLLVRRGSVPPSVAAELSRLVPDRIVVLGGSASVSADVAEDLAEYTDGLVERVSGADRYAASAAISRSVFAAGLAVVYVATGLNFPDALSGGPVGATNSGPVLLVRKDAVPASVATELERLRPRRIVILGGSASVSTGVQAALDAFVADDPPPSIRGRVTQDGGAGGPLAGVAVTLSGPSLAGGPAFSTATDANGNYRFYGVTPGDDIVVCFDGRSATGGTLSASGYGDECWNDVRDPALATPVTVTAGAVRAGVDARLKGLGATKLRITDTAGTGLNKVNVYLYGPGSTRVDQQTGSTGYARFVGLYPGTYRVCYDTYDTTTGLAGPYGYDDYTDCEGAAASLAPTVTVASGDPGDVARRITVTASGVVEGHVGDPAGNAVVGAQVTVLNEVVPGDGIVADGVTSSDGGYQIGDVRGEQPHRVCVSATGFTARCIDGVLVREARSTTLDVTLQHAP